ncbi:PREDICTED: osteoclast stimulatory transmembrane protein [Crocodylus porosus]|uniref:osteoclast stimulatory transmembrane protein n=1 Tax=Crocodylus porosus TaxID=8502 RepID=UPI00093DCA16|nr:PREDICTED: osteoclast stimulatory transmembrane protein [Crocodylus porosus]
MGDLHRSRWRGWIYCQDVLFPKIQEVASAAWSTYSKPVPSSCNELLALFLQCCCITALIGGLFYNWLFASLEYPSHLSAATAAFFSFLLLVALFLVHPFRCMFTIIVPTIGTKQGRKLLLSTCFMIVAVNITPNIMENIKTILQVIKCICKNSSESLLNSTALLGKASWEFGHHIKPVFDNLLVWKPMNGPFQLLVDRNTSVIRQQLGLAGQKIKEDFSAAELLVKGAVLISNRVVAGFFMFFLFFESAWYVKSYLTNLQFDNIYITKKLECLAVEKETTNLLACLPKNLIKSTGLKLSREETMVCLMRMMLLTLVLLLTVVIIATDHIAFYLADTAMKEVVKLPTVPVTLNIKYNAKVNIVPFLSSLFLYGGPTAVDFQRSYHQNLTFVSADCTRKLASPPNNSVALVVGLLFCIIYAMIFLETYAHRLCRKISASFFESQEEQRVYYLYSKLLKTYKKKEQEAFSERKAVL